MNSTRIAPITEAMGMYQPGQAAGFIASVIGAILVLFIYGKIKGSG